MEVNENGTKLLFEVVDSEGQEITEYSIENGKGILLNVQVSGEIQSFEEVEVGLYTMENAPLCAFGPFVVTRIPLSKFIMSLGMISVGIYHPTFESKFAHVSFWTEDNTTQGVALDFKETLKFWKSQYPDKNKIEVKLMLSGVKDLNSKAFIRNVNLITLIM